MQPPHINAQAFGVPEDPYLPRWKMSGKIKIKTQVTGTVSENKQKLKIVNVALVQHLKKGCHEFRFFYQTNV